MDFALPILAAGLLASQEMQEWSRFPPESICQVNYNLAASYYYELECQACNVGGWPAVGIHERLVEANNRRRVWDHLWWVSWNTSREKKLEHAGLLRELIGDRAFVTGDWPGPLPVWSFEVDVGGR